MALTIKKAKSTSGRVPAGFSFYSGLVVYGTSPSVIGKWGSYQSAQFPGITINAQSFFSVSDIASAGIFPYTDNNSSTATILLTAAGVTGDRLVVTCVIATPDGGTQTITIIDYTVPLASTASLTLQGADIIALVNNSNYLTGFSASFVTATITISAPKNQGIFLNSGTPYVSTATGTIAVTTTQNVIAGTYSKMAVWAYHISEFFRKNPTGVLWVGIISSTSVYNEMLALQSASKNLLRQIGIWDDNATSGIVANITGTCQKIQTAALILDQSFPFHVVYSPNVKAVSDITTMPSGQLVQYNKVKVLISQDGLAQGNFLYRTSGVSISNIGAKIGTLSSSRVSSDDTQAIDQFNISDGTENDTPSFSNGQLLSAISIPAQSQLKTFRYTFFQVFTGNVTGTFWTGNYCFCNQTNRYAFENDNRVINEITRIMNSTYIPLMSAETIYNEDGTITNESIELYQDAGVDSITAAMITGFGSKPLISGSPIVTIDPKQKLQNTNNLQISVQIGENGIARDITVTEGFSN